MRRISVHLVHVVNIAQGVSYACVIPKRHVFQFFCRVFMVKLVVLTPETVFVSVTDANTKSLVCMHTLFLADVVDSYSKKHYKGDENADPL